MDSHSGELVSEDSSSSDSGTRPTDPDRAQARGTAAGVLPTATAGSGRGGLERRSILGAAVALIDRDGLKALTMRKLGQHLGVEAMALYYYLPGREALLDGIVETVLDELYGDPDVYLESNDWQEFIQRLAHGVRRIALAHPQVFPLIATRPPAAPWIRPPLRSLRWIESFLNNVQRAGFSDEAAVEAYQSFSSFLLGHLLLEVSAAGVDVGPLDEPDMPPAALDENEYPTIAELQPLLTRNRSAEEFDDSLESLLNRLETNGKR